MTTLILIFTSLIHLLPLSVPENVGFFLYIIYIEVFNVRKSLLDSVEARSVGGWGDRL